MPTTEAVIGLSERIRKLTTEARRKGRLDRAADFRLATFYLRRLASLLIVEEAKRAPSPARKRALENEAAQLWCSRHE